LRGRSLIAPEGSATRPTTDRTREAVFNALSSLGAIEGAAVVDLFAGSGALGIEALSRGAESDRRALTAIRQNLRTLGLEDRSEVVEGRVETLIGATTPVMTSVFGPADLVFADPPYDYQRWEELAARMRSVATGDAIVVFESGADLGPVFAESSVWTVIRSKRYGRTWVTFLKHSDAFTD
jgi:16S rRNA (guanine966-N2)-methyltransferase